MKKTLYWILTSAVLTTLTYFGFIEEVEGAQYLMKFFVWAVCLPIGLLALTEALQKKLAEDPPSNALRRFISRCIAWGILVVMVWQGHFATGGAWGFYMLCCAISAHSVKQIREKAAAESA